MTIFKKYIIPMVLLILVAIGAIKINIINTKSLSPLGNSDDNFNLVSEEFGEDFSEFIKYINDEYGTMEAFDVLFETAEQKFQEFIDWKKKSRVE